MKNLTIITISVLALALVPGCDSDSDSSGTSGNGGTSGTGGTGGSGMTGLDGSLAMSDLTDDQQISACEASTAHLMANHDHETMTKAMCVMTGMMSGMMGMTCQEAYDGCMADPQPMEEPNCADEIDDLSGCTDVTVAEIEACVAAEWAQQEEMMVAMAAMTCEDIEASMEEPSDDDMDMTEEPETPAACVGVEEKCPAFFADDDGDMDMGGDMGGDMDGDDMDGDDMDGDDMDGDDM
jgi:hypothetical protein